MSALIQNILIIGGILVILGLGYFMYTQDARLDTKTQLSAQVAAESEQFLRRLNELKAIELNGDLFSDPRFVSLINYQVPVLPEPIGNKTPFDISN